MNFNLFSRNFFFAEFYEKKKHILLNFTEFHEKKMIFINFKRNFIEFYKD